LPVGHIEPKVQFLLYLIPVLIVFWYMIKD